MSLDAEFVSRFAAPPSKTTVDSAISAHTNIRALLDDTKYATTLQGSYKNDTALADMNDVDICAVDRALVSRQFSRSAGSGPGVAWDEIFGRIERVLQGSHHYAGKWKREDKCIRVNTQIRVDIVPAVRVVDAAQDPIAIYSFSKGAERLNWPRGHYEGAAAKSGRTNGNFKQTVRLFKRWSRCWFQGTKVAPSYYLECALHSCEDHQFTGDLAADFERLAGRLTSFSYGTSKVPRIAGEGDLLSPGEWTSENFTRFQTQLRSSLGQVRAARTSWDSASARRFWISAFNGYTA
jgi:hypothetical protein